jgi:hypothetical protein
VNALEDHFFRYTTLSRILRYLSKISYYILWQTEADIIPCAASATPPQNNKKYTSPTEPPITTFSTPFKDKRASECCKLIHEMTTKNNSDLNYEYLIILDERSCQDQTALVVVGPDHPDEEPLSFRVLFENVNEVIMAMVAKGLSEDFKELADGTEDDVLRF